MNVTNGPTDVHYPRTTSSITTHVSSIDRRVPSFVSYQRVTVLLALYQHFRRPSDRSIGTWWHIRRVPPPGFMPIAVAIWTQNSNLRRNCEIQHRCTDSCKRPLLSRKRIIRVALLDVQRMITFFGQAELFPLSNHRILFPYARGIVFDSIPPRFHSGISKHVFEEVTLAPWM